MFRNAFFDNLKLKILTIIMIAIPAGKLLSYVLFLTHIIKNSFAFNHVYVLWFAIPVLLVLYIIGLLIKKHKFNYLDITIIILAILAFISTIFAKNIRISILGMPTRNEGLLTILCYYLIFLNAKSITNQKDKEFLIKVFLYLGLFQVLYSVIQIYTNLGIVKRFSTSYLAMGLCANPNFLAAYMSMLVILAATLYIKSNKLKYLLLALIYNIGLTLAETSGAFLAVTLTFIFMMIYFHKKEYLKRILLVMGTLLIVFIVTNNSSLYVQEKVFKQDVWTQYNIKKELIDTSKLIINLNENNKSDIKKIGNGRIGLWLDLVPKIKDYWLVGAGLDNLAYIYEPKNESVVDKAHNVYLQMALTNGVPALILYLFLCLIIFIKGFKLKNDDITLYMVFVVYSIQAFVNISVIDVAPYFFLFFGLLASNFDYKLLNGKFSLKRG